MAGRPKSTEPNRKTTTARVYENTLANLKILAAIRQVSIIDLIEQLTSECIAANAGPELAPTLKARGFIE